MQLLTHRLSLALLAGIALCALAAAAEARPEKIRPGHSYFSDECVTSGAILDIGEEKNYEEVYQLYTYYEAVYDELGRVVSFKEYERGEVIRTERYRYAADGALLERTVQPPEDSDAEPATIQQGDNA